MLTREFKSDILPISGKLFRFASRMLQNEDDAKDVIQDIYLKLWQMREKLSNIDNVEAFAMKMTRNRCLDILKLREKLVFNDTKISSRNNILNGFETLENSDSVSIVKKIISKLPEIQKTIIHLRDIEQLEFEEIAETTNLNLNAIRVNLSRARKSVRDEILKIQNYGINENKNITTKVL